MDLHGTPTGEQMFTNNIKKIRYHTALTIVGGSEPRIFSTSLNICEEHTRTCPVNAKLTDAESMHYMGYPVGRDVIVPPIKKRERSMSIKKHVSLLGARLCLYLDSWEKKRKDVMHIRSTGM